MTELCNVVGQCVNIWSFLGLALVCVTIVVCKILFGIRQKRLLDFATKYSDVHMVIAEDNTRVELDLK